MSPVEEKVLAYFSKHKNQKYKKGELLIRADDQPPGIFYLKTGNVKVYAISKKGEELIINLFKPKSFFPMSWAINDSPNTYFYEAVTDLELFRCPKKDALGFLKNNPDVLYDLLSRVYLGTEGLLSRITHLMAGGANTRLMSELTILAKRFGKKTTVGTEIQTSEKDIASQTGMTRETINRELKILKNKELVNVERNKIVIIDSEKFQKEFLDSV